MNRTDLLICSLSHLSKIRMQIVVSLSKRVITDWHVHGVVVQSGFLLGISLSLSLYRFSQMLVDIASTITLLDM